MDDQHTVVTHYAILIGINAYPDGPLKSCVRDVQDINNYLEGVSNSVHIQMFTATESPDPKACSPVEDPVLWPTYDNVSSAFEKITSLAKAGDFVYIHYSGHGTREKPSSEFSNKFTGDLALVLLNGEKGNCTRYLWGSRLAFSLNAMVNKGLVLTLVLDCCFSATVYRRDDPSVRFLPYDPEVDSKFPLDPEKSLENGAGGPGSRNASMLPNWLINPDGYAILVACGPHEVAKGLTSEDGQRHGALSYFLLRTLIECGGLKKKHKDIYHHLCARFREFWQQQNPVLYGNKNQGFFGHINSEIDITPISIIERDGSLQLQAGQAHGVCDGDQFVLHPLGSTESNSGSKGDQVIAEVAQARALTSDLELLDMTSIRGQTRWIAKPLTQSSLRTFPIRLTSGLPHLDEWLTALKERSLDFHIDVDKHPFSFHIILNSNKEYEILDKSDQKIVNLPIMSQDQTDVSYICNILEHLVRFKMVRELANKVPADPFREAFSVQIINRSGEIFNAEYLIEVEQDEEAKYMFELQVENKGNKDLYVYVYDMGPRWQVQDIYCGTYEVIPPRNSGQRFTGMLRKKLKTIVPTEMRKKGQCQDIIKVFVTSQPTSFDLLELPKLGDPVKRHRISWTSRDGGSYSSEDWAALNFPIRTSLK
jgi:hypothetical protein